MGERTQLAAAGVADLRGKREREKESYGKVGERNLSVDLDAPVHLPLKVFLGAQFVWRDPVPVQKNKTKHS